MITNLLRSRSASILSRHRDDSSSTPGADHGTPEEDLLPAVYGWGGTLDSNTPSLSGLLRLSCRPVKLLACSVHCLVVTQEAGCDVVWSWGDNQVGQCGLGEEHGSQLKGELRAPIPFIASPRVALRSPQPVSAVACNPTASLVLKSSGTLLMAGLLPCPTQAQKPSLSFVGVGVHQGAILSVAMGETHCAALVETADEQVALVTWGFNTHGQLGHGALQAFCAAPTLVSFAWPAPLARVCCGAFHTLALLQNGRLFAWGKNRHSSIADAVGIEAKAPILGTKHRDLHVLAPAPVDLERHAAKLVKHALADGLPVCLAASESFSVLSTPRRAWTWGECTYGCLGHGASVTYVAAPSTPSLFPPDIAQLACGSRHTLILDAQFRLWALGYARQGAVGVETKASAVPTPTLLASSAQTPYLASSIAAGLAFSMAVMNLEPQQGLKSLFSGDASLRFVDLISSSSSSSSSSSTNTPSPLSSSVSENPNGGVVDNEAHLLPPIVAQTLDYIEADSSRISYEGIFRVEGVAAEKKIIERLWQTGEPLADFPEHLCAVPNLTFALKSFFRSLPPLMPYDTFELFFQAATRTNVFDQVFSLGQRLRQLPAENWAILRRLYRHGMIVIANEPRSRMGLEAVSRMWGNMSLRNPDQSPAGLMRQGEVGTVAKPILAYGHIILNEFLWNLFLALYMSVGGETALAICDLLAKETRSLRDEADWLHQLILPRPGAAKSPEVPALEAELARFRSQREGLAAQPAGSSGLILDTLNKAFDLFAAVDAVYFSEQTHMIFWLIMLVLKSQRSSMWNVPIHKNQRTLTHLRLMPHPISTMNFNFLGEDPFSTCVRELQDLVYQETQIEKQIQELELQQRELWSNRIDPLAFSYQELSFFRQLKLEELVMQKIYPIVVNSPAFLSLRAQYMRFLSAELVPFITSLIRSYVASPDFSLPQLRTLLGRLRLASATLSAVEMLSVLQSIDEIGHAAGIPTPFPRWNPTPEQWASFRSDSPLQAEAQPSPLRIFAESNPLARAIPPPIAAPLPPPIVSHPPMHPPPSLPMHPPPSLPMHPPSAMPSHNIPQMSKLPAPISTLPPAPSRPTPPIPPQHPLQPPTLLQPPALLSDTQGRFPHHPPPFPLRK